MKEVWPTYRRADGAIMGMTASGHSFVISTVEERLTERIEELEHRIEALEPQGVTPPRGSDTTTASR